ncbi:unnamed protein product [Chondrus crispus]|uniref:AB hydrolase-1 domain-containing protein n=1 Tax=Chondrus crispus TaxID=2769 RepID=R7QR90_CHOCR|nr:unnamed protein product [Chondrus crispus]CDF40987.1 unnamed protein product [Chondrus crispus]|eukprot:XP_005711281.1 unnamed protein product [Chondrus crispus]
MPQVAVPLSRAPPSARQISVSYRVLGAGPVLVLMVPGMCVPSSMYDSMAAVLAATAQFTAVVLDNRGMGRSDAPPAGMLGGLGYDVAELAADAWQVVDAVLAASAHRVAPHETPKLGCEDLPTWDAPCARNVALVGHSMGGMVVQAMMAQRPRRVRFVALLSTHAGGVWNLLPTARMLRDVVRVAWSGFDRDVHAHVNLGLHFTDRFLEDWVVHEGEGDGRDVMAEAGKPDGGTSEAAGNPSLHASPGETESGVDAEIEGAELSGPDSDCHTHITTATAKLSPDAKPFPAEEGHSGSPPNPSPSNKDDEAADDHPTTSSAIYHGLGYFESKVVDLVRDAKIYFGLSASFREKLWKPQKLLLDAITKRRRRTRSRRRDIYHARYTGAEKADPSHVHPKLQGEAGESTALTNPEDSPHALYGHAAVVRSHALPNTLATRLRECTRVVKLVMAGKQDRVVTPAASRALAHAIGANTIVEVEAAHFITDEAAAEVTTHIIYGLRKAFYAPNARRCECLWCVDEGA